MLHTERVHLLNTQPAGRGQYVLYWMQASQRFTCNLALAEAIRLANEMELPLRIFFHVEKHFPEANYRHFRFMADGLEDCLCSAREAGISFEISDQEMMECFKRYFAEAALLVFDKGYLSIQREWRNRIARAAPCQVIEVEDNLVVPIASASHKAEWSARTIRPKLIGKLDYFMSDATLLLPRLRHKTTPDKANDAHNGTVIRSLLGDTQKQAWLSPATMRGGERQALSVLNGFVEGRLANYDCHRNDPSLRGTSRLSPYLHFGHISPLEILRHTGEPASTPAFVEQLLVRRELAHNFIYYNEDYGSYKALPAWCRYTLAAHALDPRPFLYPARSLENAETHDIYWNAAMREMVTTGYMENTMRMYWGKKIIEWSASPEEAHQIILYLNNRYLVDGRDANSYAGVNWCFGLHDRPWASRPVFGTVRYMNQNGLCRKYDMEKYIAGF